MFDRQALNRPALATRERMSAPGQTLRCKEVDMYELTKEQRNQLARGHQRN